MWLRITEVIYKYIGLNFRLIFYIQKFLVIPQFIHNEKEVSYMESKQKVKYWQELQNVNMSKAVVKNILMVKI